MNAVPAYVSILFMLTAFATVGILFYFVRPLAQERRSAQVLIAIVSFWMLFQAVLAIGGFYQNVDGFPPRLLTFGPIPAAVFIIVFIFATRNTLIPDLPLFGLTIIHIIRVPVEFVLHELSRAGAVPVEMTFAGWNFDILSGLTAPVVAYFAFRKGRINRGLLIGWNFAALIFVIAIIIIAVLSLPTPIQQIGLGQPNRAVLHFPYAWLPTVVVPAVLFCHFASLYKLAANKVSVNRV